MAVQTAVIYLPISLAWISTDNHSPKQQPFYWQLLGSRLVGSFDSALFEASVQDYNSIRPDFQASHMYQDNYWANHRLKS